jgi:hypothetical protein
MAARTGMAELITELRSMADAGTADYTIAATSSAVYWSDEQLQAALDKNRKDIYTPLEYRPEQSGGSIVYFDAYYEPQYVERAPSGSEAWRIEDSNGSALGTANYTVNYDARHVRFTANQGGTAYYLRGRQFDMQRTAAAIWRQKAAHVSARAFDIATDNHNLKRSQLRTAYVENAAFWESQAEPQFVRVDRVDAW